MASFSIILPFLLFAFMVLKIIIKRSKTNDRTLNLPPGPWKLPFIGNLHQLVGSLPHHGLRDLANKYGPIMLLQIGEFPTIVVSSRELAKEVFKTHDVLFATRAPTLVSKIISYDYNDIIFSPHGDCWRQLRKICVVELLNARRVQSFRSIREEEVSDFISWIASQEGSEINFTDRVYSLIYGMTSRAAFGDKTKDQEAFVAVVQEIIEVLTASTVADLFPSIKLLQWVTGIKTQVEKIHQEVDRIVGNIIDEHNKKRKARLRTAGTSEEYEDLVDVLLKLQENNNPEFPITTDNIKAVIFDVFTGGSETSATTLDWVMSELMKNPRVMKKAQAEVREVFNRRGKVDEEGINELQFLKLVVKETMRLHPVAPLLFPRECGDNCKINGFDIPAKFRTVVNVWALGRDPEYWAEPESFIPERFQDCSLDYKGNDFEYLPFGGGRRICPGIPFAFATMELPLASLLYYFDWKLPNGMKPQDLDMSEAFGTTVRRKDDLRLFPISYHPS